MGKIKAVLFDFDGTLMDTNDLILKSWQHTFREITGKEAEESILLATFGELLPFTMRNFFGGTDEDLARNIAIYRSFHEDCFMDEISLFPGVHDVLIRLKEEGYKVALVTSRLANTTRMSMEKFGIESLFDEIITANDCSKHKPDPEPINIALEKLGLEPERAIMVGDTRLDMECAYNAGVKSVLVGWSVALSDGNELGDKKPAYIIQRADDIFDVINELNGA